MTDNSETIFSFELGEKERADFIRSVWGLPPGKPRRSADPIIQEAAAEGYALYKSNWQGWSVYDYISPAEFADKVGVSLPTARQLTVLRGHPNTYIRNLAFLYTDSLQSPGNGAREQSLEFWGRQVEKDGGNPHIFESLAQKYPKLQDLGELTLYCHYLDTGDLRRTADGGLDYWDGEGYAPVPTAEGGPQEAPPPPPPAPQDNLEAAVKEIRKLRQALIDAGIDPDGVADLPE